MKVLFICTGNSIRSQMAQAYLSQLGQGKCHAHSAGVMPSGIHPYTIEVMAEEGIDLSLHTSKHVEVYKDTMFDWVITLCGNALNHCPTYIQGHHQEHWPVEDPTSFNILKENPINRFRKTRDQIRGLVLAWVKKAL